MRAHTERFARAMRSSSQRPLVTVDLWSGGQPVQDGERLNLVSGSLQWDMSQNVVGTGSLVLNEPSRIPDASNPVSGLTPWGNAFVIKGGLVYADGTEELLQLGVFYLTGIEFDGYSLDAYCTVADRSRRINRARLEDDYPIASGTNLGTAIQSLLSAADPSLTYAFASTSHTTSASVIPAQSGPWDEAVRMAQAAGLELIIDSFDRCVMRTPASGSVSPVWEFRQGATGTLITARSALDSDGIYNRTIATGSDPALTFTPRGVYTDTDPNSPTRYDGPYGRVPGFFSSPFIQTDAQGGQAAASLGTSTAGEAQMVSIESVTHWALEPSDPVQVTHDRLNISGVYAMDAFEFDLTEGVMAG